VITVVACLALSAGLGAGQPALPRGLGSPSARSYIVKPGDTLWGIATALAGDGDPRPIVARLAQQAPSGLVVVGQRLVLP
jgi:hypothetical protein